MQTKSRGHAPAEPAPVERLTYSIDEAAVAVGISRRSVYALIAAGELTTVKVGRRRLIPAGAVRKLAGGAA